MKKLILVLAAITITTGAYTQNDSTNLKMNSPYGDNTNDAMNQNGDMNNNQFHNAQSNPGESHPDGVMMQNGKIMQVKNGQMSISENDMTMSNGTKIMSDGTLFNNDGTKTMLEEGQHIDMSGNMTPMKTNNEDRNMYLVPDSTRQEDY